MLNITARNVNDAYVEGIWRMRISGVEANSRNGKVKRIEGPVATTYKKPWERMLFDPVRDANPYFHIFEGVWMLAGRDDVRWLSQFNSNISQYSDDQEAFRGAYGHRWRNHFEKDQLTWAIEHLNRDPNSRRCVLQMYDPTVDQLAANTGGKDIPCNTAVYFNIDGRGLNMTVTCRSNDMIWGAYGANAVHMSMLQEFVAFALGVGMGHYAQFSNDFHVYEKHFPLLEHPPTVYSTYPKGHAGMTDYDHWAEDLQELADWIDGDRIFDWRNPYVRDVLNPMIVSWNHYKMGSRIQAELYAGSIKDAAVSKACLEWLGRRKWG